MYLFFACVLDQGLQGKDDADPGFDTSSDFVPPDSGGGDSASEEVCNGVDDDGNGLVDEGYPDSDGDGTADCVDSACALDTTPGGPVDIDDACVGVDESTPEVDPDFVVEWALTGEDILNSPVVAELSDDDGDGDIDAEDVPDIVGISYDTGDVFIWSGDGSGLWADWAIDASPMGVAAGDVDGDGTTNLVIQTTRELCAYEPDGTTLWCSNATVSTYNGGPTITDLDGDGVAEVIADGALLSGLDGSTLVVGMCSGTNTFPEAGDLDGDGIREVVCGNQAWTADGTELWNRGMAAYNYAALVDVDADDVPEVLITGWMTGATLLSYDGTELASTGNETMSAACVADFDGDGGPEYGIPTQTSFNVYDADLTLLWSVPTTDMSGAASCSAFDFNGDGAYEPLYADEHTFYMFDGATGDTLVEWGDHSSGTMWEYPVVADVDGDGSSEIVLVESFYGSTGVVVLGNPSDDWQPTDPTWSQYAFDGGNIADDGEVLSDPPEPWRDGGFIHARPPGHLDPGTGTWGSDSSAQLDVAITDVCAASCETGPVDVGLSVVNSGAVDATALVTLYAIESTGDREVASTTLTVGAGTRAEPLTMTLTPADLGTFGLHATVTSTDVGVCAGTDGEDTWEDLPCD